MLKGFKQKIPCKVRGIYNLKTVVARFIGPESLINEATKTSLVKFSDGFDESICAQRLISVPISVKSAVHIFISSNAQERISSILS